MTEDGAQSGRAERGDDGRFTSNHKPDDVFETMDPLEPYTTGELADSVGAPRRTVYKYLEGLAETGRVKKKKVDPRRVIWYRPSDGDRTAAEIKRELRELIEEWRAKREKRPQNTRGNLATIAYLECADAVERVIDDE